MRSTRTLRATHWLWHVELLNAWWRLMCSIEDVRTRTSFVWHFFFITMKDAAPNWRAESINNKLFLRFASALKIANGKEMENCEANSKAIAREIIPTDDTGWIRGKIYLFLPSWIHSHSRGTICVQDRAKLENQTRWLMRQLSGAYILIRMN